MNANPYQSPEFSDMYKPDWSFAKKIFVAFLAVLILSLFINSVSLWKAGVGAIYVRGESSQIEQVKRFLTDWRPSSVKQP